LSLKCAQVAYFHATLGIMPVVLADDVLGQLDKIRSENFWKALGDCKQIVATGTAEPADYEVQKLFHVNNGTYTVN
jgi:DNA replication and repair protein RecF